MLDFFKNKNKKQIYIPVTLETLNNQLVGCKLTKDGIEVIFDEKTCIYSEEEINNAISNELMPHIKSHLNIIDKKK